MQVLMYSHYSTKSDVWAAGVVFWEVFSAGERPYISLSGEQTVLYVTEGGRLDKPSNSPSDIFSLMKSCWRENPADRPSFDQIREKLKSKSSIYYYRPIQRTPSPSKQSTNSASLMRKGKSVTPGSDRKRWTLTSKKSF